MLNRQTLNFRLRIVKRTNFSFISMLFRKCFLHEIFTTEVVGLGNVRHRNNSSLSRILLKKIVVFITKNNRNYHIHCSKRSFSAQRRRLIPKTQIFQRYPFLTLNNLSSKYLWKEAFASIRPEGKFVRFRVLNSYVKFGDLPREHLVDYLVKQI